MALPKNLEKTSIYTLPTKPRALLSDFEALRYAFKAGVYVSETQEQLQKRNVSGLSITRFENGSGKKVTRYFEIESLMLVETDVFKKRLIIHAQKENLQPQTYSYTLASLRDFFYTNRGDLPE